MYVHFRLHPGPIWSRQVGDFAMEIHVTSTVCDICDESVSKLAFCTTAHVWR